MRELCPESLSYLWEVFWKIKSRSEITFQDILAWQSLSGYRLSPQEAEALIEIDRTI